MEFPSRLHVPDGWRRLTAVAAGPLAVGLFLLSPSGSAVAQTDDDSMQEDVALEEIVVTGSRLTRTGFETPSPVVVVGAADLATNSAPAVGEFLNQLPQLRTTFGLNNSSRFIGTAGIGSLDLRGLGTDRTLVLVNGRRHVSASEGEQLVDVNNIPTDMIDRIEIITGANSAVYGADATAGVVNFILKDDFDGFTARAQGGEAGDSDFGRSSIAFTFGRNFDDGRGNMIFSAGYEEQDLLTAGERGGDYTRSWGTVPNPEDGDTIDPDTGFEIDDGIPDRIYVPNQGFWAISNAGTSLALNCQLDAEGNCIPVDFGGIQYLDGLSCGGDGCPYLDLDTFQVLQVGFDRFSLDANFTYDFSDTATWYWESKYANVQSEQQGQPSFDFGAPVLIARDNAFMTDSLGAAMDAAGAGVIDLRRFNVDLGLRQEENTRETLRAVTGVRGEIGSSNFSYDVFANWGRTNIERVNLNDRINARWAAAYDAVQVDEAGAEALRTSGLAPTAAAGDIVCRATLQEAQDPGSSGFADFAYQGCVPANVIGLGKISQEAKDFINSTAISTSTIRQTQVAAVVTNPELVDLWAGPIGGVVGVEYRKEESETIGDSLSQLDQTFFNALASTVGEFDVIEYFGEVSFPLLRDVFLARDLTLEGAIRYSDYSTIGNTTTWEGRLNWQPFDDLRFRFNAGEALRAPTIGDLFAPAGQNFNIVDDPCDQDNLSAGRSGRNVRIANCQALGIADPENFDSLDESSIELLQGGNPDLQEETSETYTIGAVYTPSWVDGLAVSLDYFDITITDAIALTGSQAILDRCVDDPNGINNIYCPLVTRDSVGNIVLLRRNPLNLNELQTSGIDFEIDYVFDVGAFTVQNRLVGSWLDERRFLLNSDDDIDIVEGELGDPEWQFNYRGNLAWNNWSGFLQLRWIDEMYIEEQETLFGSDNNPDPNPDINDATVADSRLYVDLGLTYAFDFGLEVSAIIDNLTDENPPFPLFGNGGNSGIYDTIGRFYTIRAIYSFDY